MSEPDSIVSFTNNLDFSVTVYDSFDDHDNTTGNQDNTSNRDNTTSQDNTNYFATLTSLTTVSANTTTSVQLIPSHTASVLIVTNTTTNVPLARLMYMQGFPGDPLSVGQADVDAMAQTMNFIDFILKNPNDPLTLTFQDLWKDTGSSESVVDSVDQFFVKQPTYASCTFETYMMGITYTAAQPVAAQSESGDQSLDTTEQPESKGEPLDQAFYSLRTLATLMGGTWPSDFPDIVVTKFTCKTEDKVLSVEAEIDLSKLPAQTDEALKFFGSLFNVQQLWVEVTFNYGFNMGFLGTRLSIGLDAMHVPFGDSKTLTINQPTVTIDINPLFKFVVFTVTGSIPFNMFGKGFEADVSMLIDNIEASFGVVIKGGDNTSLPAPPVMQGVHFDEFGVGIGIIFAPPGAAIGLSGKLHIGDLASGTQVELADDTFVVVCQMVQEVPNPLYISFYVPQMHLTDVLTVFTNTQSSLDVPVSFTDLSFKWSEDPMTPVALPDGTLSEMGYGFSAAANILAFSFYGDIAIDLDNGLTADIEMTPLALGDVFSIGGDGTGVSIKVDASGNPIKNNLLPTKAAEQQALKDATMKELVPSGGPVLKLQTFASPFLHLNGYVSLFEVVNDRLNANITSSGIEFEVSFGELLTTNMSCTLTDYHNLAAAFQFGINQNISLPSWNGVSLGSIFLQTSASVHLSLNTSSSDLILQVGGSFDFDNISRNFGDFVADAHIQRVSDLLSAIVSYIEQNAQQLFNELLSTGAAWAGKVQQGLIVAADSVASVLHNAYNQDADQVASTMKDVGYGAETIAGELKQTFAPWQVAGALKNAFGMSATAVAQAMQQAGYAGEEVAGALKNAFGNDAGQIASALKDVYGWSTGQIQGTLGQIGFTADQIGHSFQSLGGDFSQAGQSILDALKPPPVVQQIEQPIQNVMNQIGHTFNPPNVVNQIEQPFSNAGNKIGQAFKSGFGF